MGGGNLYSGRFSDHYDKIAQNFLDYTKAISSFKKIVDKKEDIFEIGVGTGLFSIPLFNEGYSTSGIDKSPEMIISLKRKEPSFPAKTGDIRRCKNLKSHYIVVMHSSVFLFTNFNGTIVFESYLNSEWEIVKILDRIYDSLNDGGRFIMNVQKNPKKIPIGSGLTYGLVSKYYLSKKRVVKEHFLVRNGLVLMKDSVKKYVCFYNHFMDLVKKSKFRDSTIIKNDEWVILKKGM